MTDERGLFERVSLEAFQSGLSWLTILRKRDAFRAAFAGFEPDAVARFGADDVERLLGDAGIVRNRAKIEATIANARATVDLRDAGTPLDGDRVVAPSRRAARAGELRRRPGPGPGGGGAGQGAQEAPAFASSARPRSTPECRPAGWSTTTSRRVRCARTSRRSRRPSRADRGRGFSLQRGAFSRVRGRAPQAKARRASNSHHPPDVRGAVAAQNVLMFNDHLLRSLSRSRVDDALRARRSTSRRAASPPPRR